MCEDCGCSLNDTTHDHVHEDESVRVMRGLMESNDHQARHNREHFDRHGVLCINLMSSPGAGKTRLLEATAEALGGRMAMAVIEGDLETENDARRLRDKGVPAVQITTGSACHLDAGMVHRALHELPLDQIDVVFVENVGNLVCPASFDLGQHANVVLLSVTEGDDKPAKYPVMFRAADLVVLSKTDLLEFMDDFDPENAARCLRELGKEAPMLRTATGRELAISDWTAWLDHSLAAHRGARGESRPAVEDIPVGA
ncbi:MAG: hydrogenase nickel incorporation protein HypB [Wenzhouxiangella sp.]